MPIRDDLDGPSYGVICAYRFLVGAPQPLEPALAPIGEPDAGWTWTHLRLGDVRARARLAQTANLPTDAMELFDAADGRVQISQADGWVFGVLPDLERDLAGGAQGEGRLVFAMDASRLVTGRNHALRAIDDLRRAVQDGAGFPSPAAALIELMELYVQLIEDLLDGLGDELGRIEDYVLTAPQQPHDTKLNAVRRAVSRHRRELQALRSVLARAQAGRQGRRIDFLAEAGGDLLAWIEDVDREAAGLQERGRLLHEEMDTLITGATNRAMGALTIISTLLIPPTLITGAFGMNLPGIPFAHSSAGFLWAAGICVAVVSGALWLLKRRGLLG